MKKSILAVSMALALTACNGSDNSDSKPTGPTGPTETITIGGSPSKPTLFTVTDDANLLVQNSKDLSHFRFYADEGATVTINAEVGELDKAMVNRCIIEGNSFISAKSVEQGSKVASSCSDTLQFYINASGEHDLAFNLPSANEGKAKVHFTHDNQAPEFTITGENNGVLTYKVNSELYVQINAIDPNGDEIISSLINAPSFITLNDHSNELRVNPTQKDIGSHLFTVIVTDSLGMATEKNYTARVVFDATGLEPSTPNTAPELQLSEFENDSILADGTHTLTVSNNDKEGDQVSITLSGVPFATVMHKSSFGVSHVTMNPTIDHVGSHTLNVTATDEHGLETVKQYTFKVVIKATDLEPSTPINQPPKYNEISSISIPAGKEATYQIEAEDPEGKQLKYYLNAGSPIWTTVNELTGVLILNPPKEVAGEFKFYVDITDGENIVTNYIDLNIEPAKTINDFANLIGEPVEKLEALFNKDSGYNWSITENGDPIISYSWYIGSPYNFEFNLNTQYVRTGGYDHIGSPYKVEGEINKVTLDNGNYEITEFDHIELIQDGEYVHGAIGFYYTAEHIELLFAPSAFLDMYFNAQNLLEGSNVTLNTSSSLFFSEDPYRIYLKEILLK